MTLKGQFNVASPLRFITLDAAGMEGGKLVQGGIGRFVVTNLDYVQNPFSATSSPYFGLSFLDDGAGSPLQGNTSQVQVDSAVWLLAAKLKVSALRGAAAEWQVWVITRSSTWKARLERLVIYWRGMLISMVGCVTYQRLTLKGD